MKKQVTLEIEIEEALTPFKELRERDLYCYPSSKDLYTNKGVSVFEFVHCLVRSVYWLETTQAESRESVHRVHIKEIHLAQPKPTDVVLGTPHR